MGFFKSLDSVVDTESTLTGVSFSTIEYQYDSFLEGVENGSIGDNKIKDVIKYGNYFDYDNFNHSHTRQVFQKLWTNERFLKNVFGLLESDQNLLLKVRQLHIYDINNIVYDYYCAHSAELKDSDVLDTLLRISALINHNYNLKLSTIMDMITASFISLARFSSFDKPTCVKRLNEIIIKLGYEFTIKDIIYIYSVFYSDNFRSIFINTMLDVYNYDKLEDNPPYLSLLALYRVVADEPLFGLRLLFSRG